MSNKSDSDTELLIETSEVEDDINNAVSNDIYKINALLIKKFTTNVMEPIVQATKCTNSFPVGASRNLYSAYPAFNNIVLNHSEKILSIISKALKLQQIKGNIQRRDNDERLEMMLECNDVVLERVNSNLDILAGIRVNPQTILIQSEIKAPAVTGKTLSGSWNENRKILMATRGRTAKLLTARNIVRPQISFKIPVDNRASVPFEPRIKYKSHSIKPLAILAEYDKDGNIESYLHPYEFELNAFQPSQLQLEKGIVTQPQSIEKASLIYIDNDQGLKELLQDLNAVNEIAVDLEHHSYRTFQGITCLMQISTRQKDYILDTLSLRDHLHILNEVFVNPHILKVFHGADCDIEWLQRDLSIYVVNMFDTYQAAKRLNFARLSLAFLLKHYCKIDVDKSFQLADWRMRPLPEELIAYARQDTHYLLYIYDLMRQDLLKASHGQPNLLLNAYQFSTEVCKRRYVKPRILPESYMELYRKSKRTFDNRQLHAFRELYAWRDKMARQEDESCVYVLPNHMLLQIADNLPREIQGILACCNPIPPMVRQNLHVLHQYILRAREQPLVKVVHQEQIANRSAVNANKDLNGYLYCPHDLTISTEFRDDLPMLLNKDLTGVISIVNINPALVICKSQPTLNIFGYDADYNGNIDVSGKATIIHNIKFVSPYQRYLAMLPLAQKHRLEEIAKHTEQNRKKQLCPEKNIIYTNDKVTFSSTPKSEPESFTEKRTRLTCTITSSNSINPANIESVYANLSDNFSNDTQVQQDKKQCIKEQLITPKSVISNMCANNKLKLNGKPNPKQNKRKTRNKNATKNKSVQSANQLINFDFANVDFSKFQGGSQTKHFTGDFKSKLQRKDKNSKANKRINKILEFGNVSNRK